MKKKKVIYTTITIAILIFSMSNIVFAKYCSNQNITVTTKVARPIIELSKEDESNKIITGTEGVDLILNVSNYKDDKISEVGQNYYLQFYSDDIDMSKVNITVVMDGNNIQIQNSSTKKTLIKAGKKETHKYNIKITSNSNEEIKGNIKAKLVSEQIQPK